MEIHDKIKHMIIEKIIFWSKIASNMTGRINLDIIKDLNATSNVIKDHDVLICGPRKAKVIVNMLVVVRKQDHVLSVINHNI
jgi:hypothetical protein